MLLNPKYTKIDQWVKLEIYTYILYFANCPPHWTCSFELLCKALPLQWWQLSDSSAWFARSDQLNNCIQKKSILFISIVLVLTNYFVSKWTWRKELKNNSEYDNQVQIVFVYLIILQYHWHGGFFNFFSFLGIYSWKLNNSSYTDKTDTHTKSKVIWI